MGSIERDAYRTLTENNLAVIATKAKTNFKKLQYHKKKEIFEYMKAYTKTKDIYKIDKIAKEVSLMLRIDNPIENVWEERYNAMFGYKYCFERVFKHFIELMP